MRLAWLLCLLVGCIEHETDTTLTLHVSSGAAGPIDGILIYAALDGAAPLMIGSAYLPTAPSTPAMLVAGVPPPANATVSVGQMNPHGTPPATEADFVLYDPALGKQAVGDVIIVGYRADTQPVRAIAALETFLGPDQLPAFGQSTTVSIALDATTIPELFGWPHTIDRYTTTEYQSCIRLPTTDGARYFVENGDNDCDGIANSEDCKPSTYCDPSAGSGPKWDACQCP